jgi:hypothetical protein
MSISIMQTPTAGTFKIRDTFFRNRQNAKTDYAQKPQNPKLIEKGLDKLDTMC